METMPFALDGRDLALRLLCTVAAGAIIGLNRGEHGRPAGLRTTLLVGLAAAIAMIEVNLLLPMAGKGPDSFVTNDLMRLPLGILSGMGFIGAGAILRQGEMVRGVTTAATLWMMTVIGLCFGGGQLLLGGIGTALGFLTLWGLKWVEAHMNQERRASLALTLDSDGPSLALIGDGLAREGFQSTLQSLGFEAGRRQLCLELRWRSRQDAPHTPACVQELAQTTGVITVKWISGVAPPL